ncbi:MAG TPA: YciI family protein, partial [Solirubrobacteraceae bacterium]
MKYALLLYGDPNAVTPEEAEAEMPRWFAYDAATREAGAFAGGEALHETDTAKTVRVRDGQRLVTDGPFAETKEILGGFYILDVPDLDAALEWAAKVPN